MCICVAIIPKTCIYPSTGHVFKYQLPGRIEAYLSVVNFISYELIAAILWKIEKHKIGVSYEELIEEASKIYEVEFTSKDSKIYRWTHISKDIEKMLKPLDVESL